MILGKFSVLVYIIHEVFKNSKKVYRPFVGRKSLRKTNIIPLFNRHHVKLLVSSSAISTVTSTSTIAVLF